MCRSCKQALETHIGSFGGSEKRYNNNTKHLLPETYKTHLRKYTEYYKKGKSI